MADIYASMPNFLMYALFVAGLVKKTGNFSLVDTETGRDMCF